MGGLNRVVKVTLVRRCGVSEEQEALRKDTRLLLGLCLDSRARYRASHLHLNQAAQDYQNALNICRQEQGETHPQVETRPRVEHGDTGFTGNTGD